MRTVFVKRASIQLLFMTCLEDLDFTDDLTLMSHRIQNMRDKIQALMEQGMQVGLKINVTKTKLMCIGTRGRGGHVHVPREQEGRN